MKIFADALQSLERSLDVRSKRHTVLAGDIANVDTPQFMPTDIDFEQAMASAEQHSSMAEQDRLGDSPNDVDVEAKEAAHLAGDASLDGNKVDVDKTLVALAENGMQYSATSRAAGKKLAILRYVASDGVG